MSQSSHEHEEHREFEDPAGVSAADTQLNEKHVRMRFESAEVREVIEKYPLTNIQTIREFERGSRKSPKLIIHSEEGWFLLKRRAKRADLENRAVWNHEVILELERMHQPVARLIGTLNTSDSMVIRGGLIYELFEFVEGRRWNQSEVETRSCGECLGQLHEVLTHFLPTVDPPSGSFHDSETVRLAISRAEDTLLRVDNGSSRNEIKTLIARISTHYREANFKLNAIGFEELEPQPIHGDWHPGNVLFSPDEKNGTLDAGRHVVAVLDFDASRYEPRVIDLANGMLHFATHTHPEISPENWPRSLSGGRLHSFCEGWSSVISNPLKREAECLPWLMIEATIAESILPIADTGLFSTVPGFPFLKMVNEKLRWIRDHSKSIANIF